jgi:hypothetical protein
MAITTLIERHDAERGPFFILVVLAVVYTKRRLLRSHAPASYLLFVPALHALTRMGIDWRDNRVCSCIEDAQKRAISLILRRTRLAGRSAGIENAGVLRECQRGTRVRGSW